MKFGVTEKNTCYIVGAGSFDGMTVLPQPGDLVIAADGGYTYLKELGIEPDVLLGDFDSLSLVPEHEHLVRHSPIKDDTDMALAVIGAGLSEIFPVRGTWRASRPYDGEPAAIERDVCPWFGGVSDRSGEYHHGDHSGADFF